MVAILVSSLAELTSQLRKTLPPKPASWVDLHIGIDDTDSRYGGCTTYTATLVFEELCRRGLVPVDFPWLVRLNPNIPWKTRGNGALALHFRCKATSLSTAKQVILSIVERNSSPAIQGTDPSIVFLVGHVSLALHEFSARALHDVIKIREARRLAAKTGIDVFTLGGDRGIIGALAAIGYEMGADHTFEVIAYRSKRNCGSSRKVDLDSVRIMDSRYSAETFNNVDNETNRVLVCPHGPDPVLLGIRGETPSVLLDAFSEVVIREAIESVMLFKTNHGTNAHLTSQTNIADLRPHTAVVVKGRVNDYPTIRRGGHVIFQIRDETGHLDCAAYQPTGLLRKIAGQLIPEDKVRVFGGVKLVPSHRATLNVEKLEVLELAEEHVFKKPFCPACGHSCEGMGRNQGLRCRRCRTRLPRDSLLDNVRNRGLTLGVYIPPPRAHRHLTMPATRYAEGPPVSLS